MTLRITSHKRTAELVAAVTPAARPLYVYSGAKPLRPGHRLDPGGPITGKADTRLSALAFTEDPQLGQISTVNGSVTFITVVGITAAELARMKATTTDSVLADLSIDSPLLVTDVHR